jgi:predicted AAA+ superfamily ATPase
LKKLKNFSPLNYFDLENTAHLARLENPLFALSELSGVVVIDEIQRSPKLFETLRVLVDDPKNKCRFLILGSASRELIKQSSESLAGRISHIELTPFSFAEVGEIKKLWLRGGFPKSYLARSNDASNAWRQEYVRTFLEQDVPALGIQVAPSNLRRFWMMLAHYHGNTFNATEIGRSLQLSHNTVRSYVDILCGTFMIRQLQPWFENISKRQVRTPKIYFRDSGLFHTLIGIENNNALLLNPKLGASWEGFALEETIRKVDTPDCFYWAVHSQAELDLLVIKKGKRIGFEFKYTDSPRKTKSMKSALELIKLDKLFVVYPGDSSYRLEKDINVLSLIDLLSGEQNYFEFP